MSDFAQDIYAAFGAAAPTTPTPFETGRWAHGGSGDDCAEDGYWWAYVRTAERAKVAFRIDADTLQWDEARLRGETPTRITCQLCGHVLWEAP